MAVATQKTETPGAGSNELVLAGVDLTGLSEKEKADLAEFYRNEIEVSREGAVLRPARIKINKDACAFVDPMGQSLEELRGVVVYKQRTRGYWARGQEDNVPECSSMDGVRGTNKDGQERSCKDCPLNQWGSGEDESGASTRGKACKEMRRVFLVLAGYQLPAMLSLPPTSLKGFDEYISARLTKGIADVATETVVTLVSEKSGKYAYAVARFKIGSPVPPKEMLRLARMRTAIQAAAESIAVSAEDYAADDAPGGNGKAGSEGPEPF